MSQYEWLPLNYDTYAQVVLAENCTCHEQMLKTGPYRHLNWSYYLNLSKKLSAVPSGFRWC